MKNIQKITKAMKMVAASKLRAIQSKTENSRGLWQPFTALLGDTPSMYTGIIFAVQVYRSYLAHVLFEYYSSSQISLVFDLVMAFQFCPL